MDVIFPISVAPIDELDEISLKSGRYQRGMGVQIITSLDVICSRDLYLTLPLLIKTSRNNHSSRHTSKPKVCDQNKLLGGVSDIYCT